MTQINQPSITPQFADSNAVQLAPLNPARTTQIWQWVLSPQKVNLPIDATEEEIIAVFSQQNARLKQFHEVLTQLETAYQRLNFQS
jgi:hypothetical protein